MATKDTPTVHLSLASLRKEITNPDPFVVALSASKRVTFPDVYSMESVQAEEIFEGLNGSATNWTVLEQWLSAEDAAALKAEKLSIRELAAVVKAAIKYYEGIYGNAGEGNASAS